MHEVEEKVRKICNMKNKLVCDVTPMIETGVFCETVDGMAVGQVVDMIKDLCDAEKNLYKACYYKTVVKAMKEEEEEDKKYGYNNRRYASGEYAPKGRGHISGYMPPMNDLLPDYRMDQNMPFGYSNGNSGNSRGSGEGQRGNSSSYNQGYNGSRSGNSSQSTNSRFGKYGYPMDERRGMAYNNYKDAKRYYTESKDPAAKKEMDEHVEAHLMDTLDTTKEMWKDANPELKREFKEHMEKMLKDLN